MTGGYGRPRAIDDPVPGLADDDDGGHIYAIHDIAAHVGQNFPCETDSWGDELPRSEVVLIGGRDVIDSEALQRTFDGCIGTGDETQSPILRLVRKIAPELLAEHRP